MRDTKKVQSNLPVALLEEIISITRDEGITSDQGAILQACLFYAALLRNMKAGKPINWMMQDCRLAVSIVGEEIVFPTT